MRAFLAKVSGKVLRAIGIPILLLLQIVTAVVSCAVKPSVLFVAALLICVYPGTCRWLRPPMSEDISAFSLPLMGHSDTDLVAFVHGDRPFELLSIGMALAVTVFVGLAASLLFKIRMSSAAGVFFAVLLGCQLSLLLNHPGVIVQLDRQGQLREAVVTLMKETTEPAIDITSFPRVKSLPHLVEPGSIESVFYFIPSGGASYLAIALVTLVLISNGSTSKRLAGAGAWATVGLLIFVALSWPRMVSEWHWHRAVLAEQRGQLEIATSQVEQAKNVFPELDEIPRTWMLEGKIDYQRSRPSAARQYFLARKKARNGELDQALLEFAAIKESREWSFMASPAVVNRWMGDLSTNKAMGDFKKGRLDSAEQEWDLAMTYDSSSLFRPLCLAVLRSRWQGASPKEVVELVDPVLDQLADRSLKAALHAMIGDCFFAVGEFSSARERYQASLDAFSLPKTINYRALRGLLGW